MNRVTFSATSYLLYKVQIILVILADSGYTLHTRAAIGVKKLPSNATMPDGTVSVIFCCKWCVVGNEYTFNSCFFLVTIGLCRGYNKHSGLFVSKIFYIYRFILSLNGLEVVITGCSRNS